MVVKSLNLCRCDVVSSLSMDKESANMVLKVNLKVLKASYFLNWCYVYFFLFLFPFHVHINDVPLVIAISFGIVADAQGYDRG